MKSSTGRTVAIRYLADRGYGKSRNDYYTGTEAIELPTVEELRKIIDIWITAPQPENRDQTISLKFGAANRNPKDQFVKKTGKELALKRMEEREPLILPLNFISLDSHYMFSAVFSFSGFRFGLTSNKVTYLGYSHDERF